MLNSTRKPRYRRPPAKLYADKKYQAMVSSSDEQSASQKPSPSTTSLLSKLNKTSSPVSALQTLSSRKPAGNASPLSSLKANSDKPKSSLQSLAQKSAGQRGISALQTLASRQTRPLSDNNNEGTTSSQAKGSKPSLSLAEMAQRSAGAKGRTSLAQLASRSVAAAVATARAMEQTSITTKLSGLARKPSSEPPLAAQKESVDESVEKKDVKQQPEKAEPTITTVSSNALLNPLCAGPSEAALFLFSKMDPDGYYAANVSASSFPTSIGQAFYEAVKASAQNIQPFAFDAPSPDDIVLEAQSHRSGSRKT